MMKDSKPVGAYYLLLVILYKLPSE